jgi:hypothetical protein
MSGSARWLMPHAVCHVAASGLRLSKEQECMRIGPDTCRHRTLIKDRVCSVLEPWDPTVGGPDPIWGVRIPFQGSGPYTWGSWTKLGGPDCISRGPALSHGGPDSLLIPWSISLSLDTWRSRTRPCGGVRCCCWPRVVARGWASHGMVPHTALLLHD